MMKINIMPNNATLNDCDYSEEIKILKDVIKFLKSKCKHTIVYQDKSFKDIDGNKVCDLKY